MVQSKTEERVVDDRISKQVALLRPACIAVVKKESGLHFVPVPTKPDWGIWVFLCEGRLLLITPVTDTSCPQAEELANRIRMCDCWREK